MKVCIIRNAELDTNANMIRVVTALSSSGITPIVLSRSRFKSSKKYVQKKDVIINDILVENWEIQILSNMGSGIKNIFQLIKYQIIVFVWLVKNYKKFDIIHVFDLDSGIPVKIFSKFFKNEYVYHIADFYVDSRSGIPKPFISKVREIEYSLINSSFATVICTDARKQQIIGSKPTRLVVVHNTPVINQELVENLRAKYRKNDSMLKLCYIGTISEDRFIKMIIELTKRNHFIELVIAGNGTLENYVRNEATYCNRITYLGKVSYDKSFELYAECDLMFAIYSNNRKNNVFSAPNKVYEAMILGKPIIVAEGSGVDDLVNKKNMGIVVKYDEFEVEKILLDLYKFNSKLAVFAKHAIDAYSEYSWDVMKSRLIEIYDEFKVREY